MSSKQRTNTKKRQVHSEENLALAVNAVREGLSVRKAAMKYGIAKSTLSDKVTNKSEIGAKIGRKPALPEDVEKKIVSNIKKSADRGFGVSRQQLLTRTGILCRRMNASVFKNGAPTKHWWNGLKARHPDLTLRKPEPLGTVRARMLNSSVVDNYFHTLSEVVAKLNLQNAPERIWNADETGKQLTHTPVRVIAAKGSKSVVGRTANDRTNITIMATVNAKGDAMPPMIIVKGKTKKSLYGYNTAAAPPKSVWTFNDKAWMNEELGEEWFRGVFLPNCGPERPQLLILDGHGSHETLGLLELAESENIHILALPPHTTHFLQPLDRSVFGPFNKAYNRACSDFLSASACNVINKWTFPSLLCQAWEAGITTTNIVSGFRGCGIFPVNKDAIPRSAYAPSHLFDKPSPPTASVSLPTTNTSRSPASASVSLPTTDTSRSPASASVSLPTTDTSRSPASASVSLPITDTSRSPASASVSLPTTDTSRSPASASVSLPPNDISRSHDVPSISSGIFQPVTTLLSPSLSSASVSVADENLLATDMFTENSSTTVSPTEISLDTINSISSELPSTDLSTSVCPPVDDPQQLLELIKSGEIEIIATADDNGVALIADSTLWNSNVEEIFTPEKSKGKTENLQSKRGRASIKSHRLLTSDSIIKEKREAFEKKQKLELAKLERKAKREEKKQKK
ncbi:tigger transposable element-derived protein 1-like [Argopecten irradians]|uniref:tigger transposable element-derived protein 1-like n=1 Tax=Argopecten irradians TaxID=31199 RepID=UPI0037185EC8